MVEIKKIRVVVSRRSLVRVFVSNEPLIGLRERARSRSRILAAEQRSSGTSPVLIRRPRRATP